MLAQRFRRTVIIILLLAATPAASADSEPVRLATRFGNHPLTELPISVIRLGLANAPQPRELEVVHLPEVTQLRILSMLESGNDDFDLYFAGHSAERAEKFQEVPFPLTQGLLGLRVLVVKNGVAAPDSVSALKQQWTLGSGLNWLDNDILENGGFRVLEGEYANLWPMLDRGRFNAFPRGIVEAFVEIKLQADNGRDFVIEPTWLLAYPADFFTYLNRNDHELAAQLEAGLLNAQANGALDALYQTHPAIAEVRQWLNETDYQLIWLENPLLDSHLPDIPQRYWIPAHRYNQLEP